MPPPNQAQQNAEHPVQVPGPARRILVVDDNVDSAESLAMLLSLAEHNVEVAHDGPSALDIAADFQPEVVFLEVGLPGLDGFEVARQLRRQPGLQRVRIVGLSGYGQEEYRHHAQQAGFDHFLIKPVDYDVLRESLDGSSRPSS